jgi:rare lipoprotein A
LGLPAKNSKRQIDLSRAAATRLEMIQDGLTKVRIEAADLKELDRLVEYYADKEYLGLRNRWYYQWIGVPNRTLDLSLVRFLSEGLENFLYEFQLVKN